MNEAGLHSDVFYLPQKPYNVLGTLADQLSYPNTAVDATTGSAVISKECMAAILEQVDLLYLLDRPEVIREEEVNWEDALSLGEKQRLAIARLIFHKPRYAILDECTSAVSSRMEIQLYVVLIAPRLNLVSLPVLEILLRMFLTRFALSCCCQPSDTIFVLSMG